MLPVLRTNVAAPTFATWPINRLDSLFDTFFGDDGGFRSETWAGVPLAMWEDEDNIHLEVEMPGVAEKDLDVTIHNGRLFIRGVRMPVEGRNYLYNGRSYGRFERVITLPDAVDAEGVQARLSDGVLTLTLPRSPEAKPRRITLQAS